MVVGSRCAPPPELTERARKADLMYEQHCLSVKKDKTEAKKEPSVISCIVSNSAGKGGGGSTH